MSKDLVYIADWNDFSLFTILRAFHMPILRTSQSAEFRWSKLVVSLPVSEECSESLSWLVVESWVMYAELMTEPCM